MRRQLRQFAREALVLGNNLSDSGCCNAIAQAKKRHESDCARRGRSAGWGLRYPRKESSSMTELELVLKLPRLPFSLLLSRRTVELLAPV